MNEVVVENRGNVRWIKLNRPQVMNAITSEMLSSLNEELKKADEHKETRVIVLTGEGKGFCSGHDLKEVRESAASSKNLLHLFKICSKLMLSIRKLPAP